MGRLGSTVLANLGSTGLAPGFFADLWMQYGFEPFPGLVISENDVTQGGAVQLTVATDQRLTEFGGNVFECRLPWCDDLTGYDVSIDNDGA